MGDGCKPDFPPILTTKSLLANKKNNKKIKKADLPTLTFLGILQETKLLFFRPYVVEYY